MKIESYTMNIKSHDVSGFDKNRLFCEIYF